MKDTHTHIHTHTYNTPHAHTCTGTHEYTFKVGFRVGMHANQTRPRFDGRGVSREVLRVGECEFASVCVCALRGFCSCDSWAEGVEALCVMGRRANRASVSLFLSHVSVTLCVCMCVRVVN